MSGETILRAREDFVVTADGITDDTLAAQAAVDAISGPVAGVAYPAGTIRLTAPLVIPYVQYRSIHGVGRGVTVFRQDSDNVPVWKTLAEDTHSLDFGAMSLTYLSQQTGTGAYALCFTKPTVGGGSGWYFWKTHDLEITKAHVGIGIVGAGYLPIWNCSFDTLVMSSLSGSILRLVSSGGMPINTFRNLTYLGGGETSGTAIELAGAETYFSGLDIEDWRNRLLYTYGGGGVVIDGLHVERHHLTMATNMIEVADDSLSIDGARYDFSVENGAAANLWRVGSGGSLFVRGARLTCNVVSGTIARLSKATGWKTAEISGVTDDNGNVP